MATQRGANLIQWTTRLMANDNQKGSAQHKGHGPTRVLSDAQRARLEQRLLAERERIITVLDRANDQARSEEARDQSGDISAFPTHPADQGTDQQQRELDNAVNMNESETLNEIDAALDRLRSHPDRFGIDERTGRPIPMARLEEIPWARLGVEGQAAAEKSGAE